MKRDFNLTPGLPEQRTRDRESSLFLPLPATGRSKAVSVAHEQVSLPRPRLKKPPIVHKQRAASMAICAVHPR